MKKILIVLIALLIIPSAMCTNWYVDKDAPSGGNGQSWATAWNSFSSIQWSSIQPGDTLYVSGGTTSKTYTDNLIIGISGSPGKRIRITKGTDSGHNGEVILSYPINAQSSAAIYLSGKKHLIIENFKIVNWPQGVQIRNGNTPGSTQDIIIQNNHITTASQAGVGVNGWNQAGMYNYIQNVVIRNNYITSVQSTQAQTDLIYAQYFENLTIENNTLIQLNNWFDGSCKTSPHADPIQTNRGYNQIIRHNYIEYKHHNGCSLTLMLSLNIGNTDIYGNIINSYLNGSDTAVKSIIGYKDGALPPYDGPEYLRFYNNIIIGDHFQALYLISPLGTYEVKNNIFYSMIEGGANGMDRSIVFLLNPPENMSNINGNLYWGIGGYSVPQFYWITWSNRPRTWEQVQATGAEQNGLSEIPLFTNFDNKLFSLQIGSPGIDDGLSLNSKYNLAYNGIIRPQGAGWDIGAFEFVGGVQCHSADVDCDGCFSLSEISSYVDLWLRGSVTLVEVSGAINLWLQGC